MLMFCKSLNLRTDERIGTDYSISEIDVCYLYLCIYINTGIFQNKTVLITKTSLHLTITIVIITTTTVLFILLCTKLQI